MKRIDNLITNLQSFQKEFYSIVADILKEDGDTITEMVTDEQLYRKGTRGSDGVFLAEEVPYTSVTIRIKSEKGQPTDRVTLRDTEDFHNSFEVKVNSAQMEIVAYDWKTEMLKTKYGEGIMALSEKNLGLVQEEIIKPGLIVELEKVFDI